MSEADKFSYKNCRKRTNFTQREVCDYLNIAEVATLSNYETGLTFTVKKRKKLKKADKMENIRE